LSTNNSPFISVEYEGEEFPNIEEHSLMGYDPDRIFLSQDKGREELEKGLNIQARNLKDLFSQIMDVKLVFRYQNGLATSKRAEEDDIDEFRTAPQYSFDLGEAELDPNSEWMKYFEEITQTVNNYRIKGFNLKTSGESHHSIENLQTDLQTNSVEIIADIEGLASIKYYWEEDKVEIEVYSDRVQINDPFHDMSGLIDLKRDQMNRRVNYHIDREKIEALNDELEEVVDEVDTIQLSESNLPPELEK